MKGMRRTWPTATRASPEESAYAKVPRARRHLLLPGLVEANESSIPVLAINTDIAVSSRGKFTLTELDQRSLMRPLTKWNAVLDRAADIPRTFRAAFESMTTGVLDPRTSRFRSTSRMGALKIRMYGPILRLEVFPPAGPLRSASC